MAKMNEQEIKRTFEDIGAFEPDQDVMMRDLQAIRGQIAGQPETVRPGAVKSWRILMTSRWTKIASVAAALLIGFTLTKTFFSGSQLNAAELLTRAAEKLNTLTWVKQTSQRYMPDQNEPVSTRVTRLDSARKRVYVTYHHVQMGSRVALGLMDFEKMETSSYNSETNEVVIAELFGRWAPPSTDIRGHLEKIRNDGLEVSQSEERIEGRSVFLIEYTETFNDLGQDKTTKQTIGGQYVKTVEHRFVIRQSDFLPETMTEVYRNHDGDTLMTDCAQLEYVETGPADLYELGVPRDAEIINRAPSQPVKDLRSSIDQHRDQFLKEYMAAIIESRIVEDRIDPVEALISFRHGESIRIDQCLWHSRSTAALPQEHAAVLADSLACLRRYWPENDTQGIRSVRVYDGLWQYSVRTSKQQFMAVEKQRHPSGDPFRDVDITDMGWPQLYWLGKAPKMIEDSFAQDHRLVGMEVTRQSQGGVTMPKRLRLYADPNRDYLVHRYVSEETFDAPWQADKDWLDSVESTGHLRAVVRDHQITEYGRTSQGQWYPKEITIQGYDQEYDSPKQPYSRIVRIHLVEENPEFPDSLFDPNALPGSSDGD